MNTKKTYNIAVQVTLEILYELKAENPDDAFNKFSQLEAANLIGASAWQYSNGGSLVQQGTGYDHDESDVALAEGMEARIINEQPDLRTEILWSEEVDTGKFGVLPDPEDKDDPTAVYRRNNDKPKGPENV